MRQIGRAANNEALSGAANELAGGRTDNTDIVTLTASATTTAFPRNGVAAGDIVLLGPRTANAAAALATTFAVCTKNLITFTHASTATVDRTFGLVFFGQRKQ